MSKREAYDWPSPSEWKGLSREERIARVKALKEQADRQRAPHYTGAETLAQQQARKLGEMIESG